MSKIKRNARRLVATLMIKRNKTSEAVYRKVAIKTGSRTLNKMADTKEWANDNLRRYASGGPLVSVDTYMESTAHAKELEYYLCDDMGRLAQWVKVKSEKIERYYADQQVDFLKAQPVDNKN